MIACMMIVLYERAIRKLDHIASKIKRMKVDRTEDAR